LVETGVGRNAPGCGRAPGTRSPREGGKVPGVPRKRGPAGRRGEGVRAQGHAEALGRKRLRRWEHGGCPGSRVHRSMAGAESHAQSTSYTVVRLVRACLEF
jgi:hypothetical protein